MPAPGTLLACFMVSLACGTLYVYSAYAPQLSSRLGLGAVVMSQVGMAGNLAMSLAGPVAGGLVDRYGFKAPMIVSLICNWVGYTLIRTCYESRIGTQSVLSVALILIGVSATFAFSATIKCAALNYPHRRGVATSVAMAGYGVSAFVFSSLATLGVANSTSGFLSMLSFIPAVILVTFGPLVALGERTMKASTSDSDSVLLTEAQPEPLVELRRLRLPGDCPGPNNSGLADSQRSPAPTVSFSNDSWAAASAGVAVSPGGVFRTTSIGPIPAVSRANVLEAPLRSRELSGLSLLRSPVCWCYAAILGGLAGMGQSYIYSCGYIVRALVEGETQQQLWQASQVSWLSIANCAGRIISGLASDFVRYKLKLPRSYVLIGSTVLAVISQLAGRNLTNIEHMHLLSIVTGLFYGACFGAYPGVVSDAFGLLHFSSNWGLIALSPVPVSYFLTVRMGKLYDRLSTDGPCLGPHCFQPAFSLTLFLSLALLGVLATVLRIESRDQALHPHAS